MAAKYLRHAGKSKKPAAALEAAELGGLDEGSYNAISTTGHGRDERN